MTGRERIQKILNRQEVDRSGFWMGNPHHSAKKIYCDHFNVSSKKALEVHLNNDLRWVETNLNTFPPIMHFKNISNRNIFKKSLSDATVKNIETLEDIANLNWIKTSQYRFIGAQKRLERAHNDGMAVFGGINSNLWHFTLEFFGMQECFMLMYTNPELVHEVMRRGHKVFLDVGECFLTKYASGLDSVFHFNDLGTQISSMVSVDMFREFFLPYLAELVDQAHRHNVKFTLHSCGAIESYIPDLINIGVDVLHPIQAKATNMDAENLASKYKNDILFMGGLDTQEILPFGTPEDVKKEVKRIREIFGEHFIVSPSHEALLKNVSPENLLAMCEESTALYK